MNGTSFDERFAWFGAHGRPVLKLARFDVRKLLDAAKRAAVDLAADSIVRLPPE